MQYPGTTALAVCAMVLTLVGCQSTPDAVMKKVSMATDKMTAAEAKLPAGYERLTGDRLNSFISDSTVTGKSARNPAWSYVVYRAPDGSVSGTSSNGDKTSTDKGKWWTADDHFCAHMNKWAGANPYCMRIYENRQGMRMAINGDGSVMDGKTLDWGYSKGNTNNL